jgi:hypothetical protein
VRPAPMKSAGGLGKHSAGADSNGCEEPLPRPEEDLLEMARGVASFLMAASLLMATHGWWFWGRTSAACTTVFSLLFLCGALSAWHATRSLDSRTIVDRGRHLLGGALLVTLAWLGFLFCYDAWLFQVCAWTAGFGLASLPLALVPLGWLEARALGGCPACARLARTNPGGLGQPAGSAW